VDNKGDTMNTNIQPFSIKYTANDGNQYVARSVIQRYNYVNGQADAQPVDSVNVCRVDDNGQILSTADMSHEQFMSYLLQNAINVPYNQYEMPKTN